MHEAMLAETTAVEERIRLFSEQQYAVLKMQRLRAEQELRTLCNVIKNVPEIVLYGESGNEPSAQMEQGGGNKALIETPPATPDNTPMSIGNSPPLGAPGNTPAVLMKPKLPNKAKNVSASNQTGEDS